MINDLTDIEPLLGQYDHETVLVGPLLNLSINSSFRFFYIAGNGNKIYASIGLGFIEFERDAQRQRAEVIARLQSRFSQVTTLDSQLELAQAAQALWPNEETARFLATTALEAKLQPARAANRDQSLNSALADAIASVSTHTPPSSRDQAQLKPDLQLATTPGQPNADARSPRCGDPPLESHSALTGDDIALAVLGLKSFGAAAETGIVTQPLADTANVAQRRGDGTGNSTSTTYRFWYRFCAVGAAALIAGMIVFTSTRKIAEDAATVITPGQLISANGRNDSPITVTGSIPPNRMAKVNDTVPPNGPAPSPTSQQAGASSAPQSPPSPVAGAHVATAPDQLLETPKIARGPVSVSPVLQSQPLPFQPTNTQVAAVHDGPQPSASEGVSAQFVPPSPSAPRSLASSAPRAKEAAVSASQSPQPTTDSSAKQLNLDEIASFVSRGSDFLKSGDVASARLLLRRAAESGNADAALLLGKTFDPSYLRELGAIGIEPDIAQCRQWYAKAAELGSEAAAQQLANLAQAGR